MPKTKAGKWAVSMAGAFIVLLLVFYGIVISGQRGGETYFSNLALAIPITLAGVCAVAGLVVGLIAVIRKRERSGLVYVAIVIGALVTLWTAAEIIFPH